ncbi:MAG: hypothetical protein HON90_06690 [Halobacteriovoraceae bacterium]|nr:hypothetical protein [Halobacteriovoraceae bacterium]
MNSAHLKYYALLNHEFRMDNSSYLSYIKDLNISLHPLMKLPNIPFLPYSLGNIIVYGLHILLYVLIYIQTGSLIYPLALAAGLLGHPIQGIFVNYFGHIGNRFGGYRNFETDDQSCNNPIVALCIFGEGYQNNHHHDSSAVNFAMAKGEFDFGYQVCRLLRFFKLAHF